MPLTQLDTTPALVLIDLQKGIVGIPAAQPAGQIVARAAQLARAFRERGLPVVLVHVTGRAPGRTDAGLPKFALPPDWTELVSELGQQPGDYVVAKQSYGAFLRTDLDEYLRGRAASHRSFWRGSQPASESNRPREAHTIWATTSRSLWMR